MTKTTNAARARIAENDAFIKLITSKKGATSEELRVAMNRAYAPTQFQLRPIADRMGYELFLSKAEGETTRYYFAKPAKAAKAKGKKAGNDTAAMQKAA